MDSSNTSSKAPLIQEDQLSSIRRSNKTLILIFFSLIISLALIIGGIIISLIHKLNLQSPNFQNPAIQEYRSVTWSEPSCINSLSSAIKTTPYSDPNQILLLSLEKSVNQLTGVVSSSVSGNCSGSLRQALSQLSRSLRVIRINPDVETMTYEQKGDVIGWIAKATDDLRSCAKDESRAEDEVWAKVHDVNRWVRYSKYFLLDCEIVNENFRLGLRNDGERWRKGIVEDLTAMAAVSLFGSQYLVLLFLFCLFLRIY